MTSNVPFEQRYEFHLIGKTIRILNDHYFKDKPQYRFGLVDYKMHEDIKEAFGGVNTCIWILNKGTAYRNRPLVDAYHHVYEFIYTGWMKKDVYQTK
jgi:hypothetical protein